MLELINDFNDVMKSVCIFTSYHKLHHELCEMLNCGRNELRIENFFQPLTEILRLLTSFFDGVFFACANVVEKNVFSFFSQEVYRIKR